MRYPMFIADLVRGLQTHTLDIIYLDGEGWLYSLWAPAKRGANYGIKGTHEFQG